MSPSDLALPFLSGLAGGFSHCIGMCGIFVLSASSVANLSASETTVAKSALWGRQLMFQGGRMLSLAALGLVAGMLGSLPSFRGHVPAAQGATAVIAGALLAVLAVGQVGIAPRLRLPEPDILGAGGGRGRRAYARVMQSRHVLKPLALGILVGSLPCGLTYYVLIYGIATGSPMQSAAIMLAFWLGTVPGLLLLGALLEAAPAFLRSLRFRSIMTKASGFIMGIMAGVLLYRGWQLLHAL